MPPHRTCKHIQHALAVYQEIPVIVCIVCVPEHRVAHIQRVAEVIQQGRPHRAPTRDICDAREPRGAQPVRRMMAEVPAASVAIIIQIPRINIRPGGHQHADNLPMPAPPRLYQRRAFCHFVIHNGSNSDVRARPRVQRRPHRGQGRRKFPNLRRQRGIGGGGVFLAFPAFQDSSGRAGDAGAVQKSRSGSGRRTGRRLGWRRWYTGLRPGNSRRGSKDTAPWSAGATLQNRAPPPRAGAVRPAGQTSGGFARRSSKMSRLRRLQSGQMSPPFSG